MLSSAIVVFREVFEIVLIVGLVLAATRSMPHRKKAVGAGFAAGIAGAVLLAVFTGEISGMAEGMGQEIFNAAVLYAAAGFIGWTVIWMKAHAGDMKRNFESAGLAVAEGRAPFLALSAVIAMAIWREGAEIVLFSYGMLAAGQGVVSLAAGAATGLAAGLVCGLLFYMGLAKLPVKPVFRVTSWLLVLLVAGMAANGTAFLVAAGAFENLSFVVWDMSGILDDRTLAGQSLSVLTGYAAQPTAAQVVAYFAALGVLAVFMRTGGGKPPLRAGVVKAALLLAAAVAAFLPGRAEAAGKVYLPYVEKGEVELEWISRYVHGDDGNAWQHKAAIGYGVTDRWFTEIYAEAEKEGGEGYDFSALEWENRFQLVEAGEYWVDPGLLLEYEINTAGGADEAAAALLLAKDTGRFSHAANLKIEKEIGEDAEGGVETGLSWSSRYRYTQAFEPGFEYHAGFGRWRDGSDWDEESHQAGPFLYGKAGNVVYTAGYLAGLSHAAPDSEFRLNLEYEFRF